MSRSFGLVGLPRDFEHFQKTQGLKVVGKKDFKEYFYSDGYAMKIYEDKNGETYEEFECGCPWSSGPELYLGLKKSSGEVIMEWSKSSMGYCDDVELPENYTKDFFKEFILEYDLPLVKGYCPLYVERTQDSLRLYQDVEHRGDPNQVYKVLNLIKAADGPVIIDWLHQQGYSVEEIDDLHRLRFP